MKSLKISKGAIMTWLTVMEYLCHKGPLVNISRSFPHITWCITRSTRRVPLVEQELRTLPRHLSSPSDFSGGGSCYSVFSFMCMFCRSLFFLLYFFLWSFCYLSFDLRLLITPLFGVFKFFLLPNSKLVDNCTLPQK
jgi:hypothetical protein